MNCCPAIYVLPDSRANSLSTKGLDTQEPLLLQQFKKQVCAFIGPDLGRVPLPVSSLSFDSLDRVALVRSRRVLLRRLGSLWCINGGFGGLLSLQSLLFEFLLLVFLLALQVVLCQVAVLAESVRVVRLVGVLTSMGHLGLAFAVVADVAHVLRVVFLIEMGAKEDVLLVSEVNMPVHVHHCLSLKVSDCIFGKILHLVLNFIILSRLETCELLLAGLNVTLQLILNL